MNVLKYCCFFDNFFWFGKCQKTWQKQFMKPRNFWLGFFTNHLNLVNSIPVGCPLGLEKLENSAFTEKHWKSWKGLYGLATYGSATHGVKYCLVMYGLLFVRLFDTWSWSRNVVITKVSDVIIFLFIHFNNYNYHYHSLLVTGDNGWQLKLYYWDASFHCFLSLNSQSLLTEQKKFLQY